MKRFKRLDLLARTALAFGLLLQSALSFADDTEIYLSRGKSDVKSNVFFILDDSLSMQWCWDKDWTYPNAKTKAYKCPNGTFENRFDVLKETLNQLLPEVKNVRFGMMWMDSRNRYKKNDKGRLIKDEKVVPVDDIENVRAKVLDLINTRNKPNLLKTPIDRSLFDAARYFNGFAKGQYPGNKDFQGHSAKEAFKLKDDIPSPITDSCQPNHIVLLTDGDAWYDDIYRDIRQLIGRDRLGNWDARRNPCARQQGASSIFAEACVPELAEWLHNNDQMPDSKMEGNQTVNVHVISLAPDLEGNDGQDDKDGNKQPDNPKKVAKRRTFLKNIASSGGGNYYEARNGEKLLKSFKEIFEQIASVDNAAFFNPSAAASNSQRTTDQIYYGLFKPDANDRWGGNLKRYRFGTVEETKDGKKVRSAADIFDVNNKKARDAKGNFLDTAQSFWSAEVDGAIVGKGGAAWQLPEPGERNLFVEVDGTLGKLDGSNAAIKKELLQAENEDERELLLNYIQGHTYDGSAVRSKALGDILHSAPVLFSYGNNENDQMAIVGTNEGFVHLFNRKTGVEEFAFMPGELLKNIKPLQQNSISTKNMSYPYRSYSHPYGVDNTVTLWSKENSQKQLEHVYAYITLRRGGEGIYALDITERTAPKLLWKKSKGDKGFERLGQTWSQPVKSKIKIANEARNVLIFGGGYDVTEDDFNKKDSAYRGDEAQGNAIYIVDAEKGDLLWSASKSGSNLNLPDMNYSIPATVSVIDIDRDGRADQLVVGDTGGQVWRLFMHNGKTANSLVTASGFSEDEPFAKLGEDDPQNARRFYHEAYVAQENSGKGRLMINIGSGYRAHPLNKNVDDRFYSLRANLLTSDIKEPLKEKDLYPALRVLDSEYSESKAIETIDSKAGWYLSLNAAPGEKMLSTAWMNGRYIEFNTYVPAPNSHIIGCQVQPGKNHTYRLNIRSAAPPVERIEKSTVKGVADKIIHQAFYRENNFSGILSSGTSASADGRRYRINGMFIEQEGSPCLNPMSCKTYWIDLEG